MTVRVERSGPVTTVILDRPAVHNAVNGPTAAALAEAFADFDADPDASGAVLFGAGGTFCAGADLRWAARTATRSRPGATGRWAPPGWSSRSRSSPRSAGMPSRAGLSSRSGVTCGL